MTRYFIKGKEITKDQADRQNKRNNKYLDLATHCSDPKKAMEYMEKCSFIFCVYDKAEEREITSTTYKRAQKRLDKEVAAFMGVR